MGAAAADTTYTYTVMGNVAAGAKAGVGAGVAYTDIGGSSGDAAKAGQVTNAGIKERRSSLRLPVRQLVSAQFDSS